MRRDGTVDAMRARLRRIWWRTQYDGEPFGSKIRSRESESSSERCDALCTAAQATVARLGLVHETRQHERRER